MNKSDCTSDHQFNKYIKREFPVSILNEGNSIQSIRGRFFLTLARLSINEDPSKNKGAPLSKYTLMAVHGSVKEGKSFWTYFKYLEYKLRFFALKMPLEKESQFILR
uniref:Uncharacterized protein n=1 Tax=Pyxicephalus adspersus TaxID=30357 RepID=A0AAV3APK0_PYXAD|nr:TPA: hypothetical protein GDO54_011147 [Pyxicephalus adspersus]